jgi:hypothetical protein
VAAGDGHVLLCVVFSEQLAGVLVSHAASDNTLSSRVIGIDQYLRIIFSELVAGAEDRRGESTLRGR